LNSSICHPAALAVVAAAAARQPAAAPEAFVAATLLPQILYIGRYVRPGRERSKDD